MSYLRMGSIFMFVDGESTDYIFPTAYVKGKKSIDYIEDYGSITNEGIIEIMFRCHTDRKYFNRKDVLMVHLLKRLAENLNVKLRKKPLTDKQVIKLMCKRK